MQTRDNVSPRIILDSSYGESGRLEVRSVTQFVAPTPSLQVGMTFEPSVSWIATCCAR